MTRLPRAIVCLTLGVATTAGGPCVAQQGGGASLDETLALLEWTPQRAAALAEQETLSEADQRELARLALRLGRFETRLRRDAQAGVSAALRPVVAPVTVERAEAIRLDAQQAARLGMRDYVLLRVNIDGAPAVAVAPRAPRAWTAGAALPQSAEALALEARRPSADAPGVYAVVDWNWRPTEPKYPAVNFGETVLGGLGVDVAELDTVVDGGPLTARDSESFYAILGAMRKTGANQLTRFARANFPRYAQQWSGDRAARVGERLAAEARRVIDEDRYPIAPLFNDAGAQRGELYVLEGTARRAVRIEAASGDPAPAESLAAQHGVDHYFELEVFTADSRNLPIVFIALELPEGFPLGDRIREPVRVAGFSFKRWAYRTRQVREGEDKPQLAPLLIGRAPIRLAPAGGADARTLGLVAGGAFVVLLAALWVFVWRTQRGDAAFESKTLDRLHASRTGVDPQRLAELDAGETSDA